MSVVTVMVLGLILGLLTYGMAAVTKVIKDLGTKQSKTILEIVSKLSKK